MNEVFRYTGGFSLCFMVTLDHCSLVLQDPDSLVKSKSLYIKVFRAQVFPKYFPNIVGLSYIPVRHESGFGDIRQVRIYYPITDLPWPLIYTGHELKLQVDRRETKR